MTRTKRAGTVRLSAVALGVIAGWGGLVVAPAASGAASASEVAVVAVACPPASRGVCVDRADGGRTVSVRVGQTVRVALGGSMLHWSALQQLGPKLLRRRGAVRHPAGGLAATYAAVRAGRTTLRASGAPTCAPGRACPQFILVWQVHLLVR
jgi:hypothetical protein